MSNGVVYRRVPPLDSALVAAARDCRVSDLHEALGPIKGRMATMSERMRPLALGIRMAGVARHSPPAPGDNLMLHRALRLAERDQVLVVAASAETGAQWGYLAALYAEAHWPRGRRRARHDPGCRLACRAPLSGLVHGDLAGTSRKEGSGGSEHSGRLRWGHCAPGRPGRGGRGRRDRRTARGRGSHHSARARSRGG